MAAGCRILGSLFNKQTYGVLCLVYKSIDVSPFGCAEGLAEAGVVAKDAFTTIQAGQQPRVHVRMRIPTF